MHYAWIVRFYAKTGYDKELRKFCLENGIKYQSFWTLGANPEILKSEPMQTAAAARGGTPQQVMFRWLIQCGHQVILQLVLTAQTL